MSNRVPLLARRLKALGDPLRLRLYALCVRTECSVSELTAVTGLSQPRVSQHLKQLTDCGLVERFRDGHFVFYRVPLEGGRGAVRRRLLALIDAEDPILIADIERLRKARGRELASHALDTAVDADRAFYQALVELSVAAPLGDLLDVGSGEGRLLKLLASRARRAVGVDTDPDARRLARAELLLAESENCSVRQGSMYRLPFASASFDTVVLDDVLGNAEQPAAAIGEAQRLLKSAGRLVIVGRGDTPARHRVPDALADWCRHAGLRLTPVRRIGGKPPVWFIAIARPARAAAAAA